MSFTLLLLIRGGIVLKKSCESPFYCQILKDLRKKNGYTQNYVATQISVEVKTYRSWEIGYYKDNVQMFPKIDNEKLEALADLYSVSIDYILGRSKCTSVENEKIREVIGLDDYSIETLKNIKRSYHFEKDLEILNYIMSDTRTFGKFLGCIKDYIKTDYTIPLHPERDKKTKNTKFVEDADIYTYTENGGTILKNHERHIHIGRKSGEYKGEPLYELKGIPISQLSTLNLLQIQEILQIWKQKYKGE